MRALALFAIGVILASSVAAESPPNPELVRAARAEFAETCVRCHQADGSGYAALGIPNFTDPDWQGAHSDTELIAAIRNGSTGKMPPFGAALRLEQIQALVVDVVRGFAPKSNPKNHKAKPAEPPPQPIEPAIAPPGRGAGQVVLGNVGMYTQHNDNSRSGVNLRETILKPARINGRQFGLLFRHVVDDQVFAQPLYVPNVLIGGGRHNVVLVATAANSVYAFDADHDAPPYWQVNLGAPGSVQQHHFWCLDILGNMGIIGTPVIDPAAGTLFVVVLTHEGSGWAQRLHALNVATGRDRPHSPQLISAKDFDPILQNQRPALLLSRGSVYVGYSSHCDVGPYHGFLFRFDPVTLRLEGLFNTSPDGDGNSIWQSGQGPAADADGNLYFVTSNGVWDGRRNFSDSVLKLSPDLRLLDWFTPSNYQELDRKDHDLNSSGPLLLPGHRVMGVGKEGELYLLSTDSLGHLGDEHAVQHFRAAKSQVNGGAVSWQSAASGSLVYLWGVDDVLRAYRYSDGAFASTPAVMGAATAAYPGAMLSLSADGDQDGILWANASLTAHGSSHLNGPAVLRAYDAADISHELWNSNLDSARDNCGRVSKNAPPTVVNGKVYVASFGALPVGTGALYVYGLKPH